MTSKSEQKNTVNVEHAGVFRRVAALVYDIFLIVAIWFGVTAIGVVLNGGEEMPSWANHYILFPALVISTFLFYYWFWTHGGQTLGMRAWRLKVINLEKEAPTLTESLKRFSSAVLLLGSGFLYCFFNAEKKSLHDLASKTQVVLLPKDVY